MNLEYNDWKDNFCPIENHFNNKERKCELEQYVFFPRGEEFSKVFSHPHSNIWCLHATIDSCWLTSYDSDEFENNSYTVGYIITLNPWIEPSFVMLTSNLFRRYN